MGQKPEPTHVEPSEERLNYAIALVLNTRALVIDRSTGHYYWLDPKTERVVQACICAPGEIERQRERAGGRRQ